MNKTFCFQLNHPAHYHLYKNTIIQLKEKGYNVKIGIKDKDVLRNLLGDTEFYCLSNKYRKQNTFSIISSLMKRNYKLFKLLHKMKPNILIGTSPEIGHVGKILHIPSIFFGEDDINLSSRMWLGALSCYPFFSSIVSPVGCNNTIWNYKTIRYNGFQKLAYLHPNYFTPDKFKVESDIFFILRLAALNAYHDNNKSGINNHLLSEIIKMLSKRGKVLISSERKLDNEFEKYLFHGNINDMHHYLAYASLYIGDSQSMAVEAAMLGTPSIRFNDFAGKISVLEELEKKYKLTFAIKSNNPVGLFDKIKELLATPDLKQVFRERRDVMLAEKIDVTKFMVWFIENYPESKKIMKENPEYQYSFK